MPLTPGFTMPGVWAWTPTELIGDFDSVEQQCIDDYPDMIIHRHKPDKDETDTELGIELLRKRGARRIHIVGGGGGRLDHLYALLSLFHRENPPDYWYTHREHIQLIQGEMLIYPGINRRVSFFPLGTGECRMKTSGLKWPLDSLRWKVGDFGISNIVTNEEVKIEMKKGKLIMVYDLGKRGQLMSDVFHELSRSLGDEERKALLKRISDSLNYRTDAEDNIYHKDPKPGRTKKAHRKRVCSSQLAAEVFSVDENDFFRETPEPGRQ